MASSKNRGRLISFEGGEGAGKSTVLARVRATLEATGQEVLQTREPGGTAIGESIRAILLDSTHTALADNTELLLMFAARAQLVRELIEPALAHGTWVLSDRFTDSSFAYQGGGRGMDYGFIAELERRVVGIRPDLTLLLDLPVSDGHARLATRDRSADRIEIQRSDFFDRVRTAYLARATGDPQRIRILDASRSPDQVADAASAEVLRLLASPGIPIGVSKG